MRDLNPRAPDYQPVALPTELVCPTLWWSSTVDFYTRSEIDTRYSLFVTFWWVWIPHLSDFLFVLYFYPRSVFNLNFGDCLHWLLSLLFNWSYLGLILKVESLLENKQLKYTYSIQLSLSGGYKKLKDYVQDIVERLVLDTFSKKK